MLLQDQSSVLIPGLYGYTIIPYAKTIEKVKKKVQKSYK